MQENTQTIQRCKSLNFRALFAFGPCASKTRKSRFIRLAVKLSAGYLRPPNGAPKEIGRDGRRSENAPKVFGHNGTLRGNKRAREKEEAGGTCDISAISEITGFEETRKGIVGLAIYGALGS